MAEPARRSLLKTAALLIWPLPVGWFVWFLIYCSGVDRNDGRGFPDEMFWWDEAIFVSLFLGTIFAAPVSGLIALILFMAYAKRQIEQRG